MRNKVKIEELNGKQQTPESENNESSVMEIVKSEEVLDAERLATVRDADLKVIAELLQEIRNENSREMKYAKTQMRLAVFTSFTSLIIIIIIALGVAFIVPRVMMLANQADAILRQTDALMMQAETVMDNMEQVTTELATADITGMLKDMDTLVTTSEEGMGEALKKVTDIDIDSLNEAIKDLGAIVAPLAKLLGR